MLSALTQVVLPVVIVACIGVLLGRRFPLNNDTVGKISVYGLTPALAFSSLMKTEVSFANGAGLIVGYLAVTGLAGLLTWVIATRFDTATRRGVTGSVILGNNGNFGLPIALLALGQHGLDQAVLIFLTSLVIMYTVGPALLGAPTSVGDAFKKMAGLPVFWTMLLAIALRLTQLSPPTGIARGVDLLAGATVPMVLLALGIQLAQSERVHLTAPVLTAVLLRVLVVPVLAVGVALLLGPLLGMGALAARSLVLACAMPTAVNTFVIAREYGSDPDTAASAVALSTLASIATIALTVWLLPGIG